MKYPNGFDAYNAAVVRYLYAASVYDVVYYHGLPVAKAKKAMDEAEVEMNLTEV